MHAGEGTTKLKKQQKNTSVKARKRIEFADPPIDYKDYAFPVHFSG
jgi:hypothetical protein